MFFFFCYYLTVLELVFMETTTGFSNGSHQQGRYTYMNDHYGYSTENNHYYTNANNNYYTGSNSNQSTQYGTKFRFNISERDWKRLVPEDLTEYNTAFKQQPNKTMEDYQSALLFNETANQNLCDILKNKMVENKLWQENAMLTEQIINYNAYVSSTWKKRYYDLLANNRELQKKLKLEKEESSKYKSVLAEVDHLLEVDERIPMYPPKKLCANKIPEFKTKPSKFLGK